MTCMVMNPWGTPLKRAGMLVGKMNQIRKGDNLDVAQALFWPLKVTIVKETGNWEL